MVNEINQITMVESSPEKAGVGGSIPSLATIESITYNASLPQSRSKTVQSFLHFPCPVERVYFFQIVNDRNGRSGLVKIGRSKYPMDRAYSLSSQYIARLQVLGWTNGYEHEWHNRFDEQCVCGEWFSPSDELMQAIQFHCDPKRFGEHCYLPDEPRFVGGYR